MSKMQAMSRHDIEEALRYCNSAKAACRYLRCTQHRFKRYAMFYKDENGIPLYEKFKNRGGTGIKRKIVSKKWNSILNKILSGIEDIYDYPPERIRQGIIELKVVPEICGGCGFCETRITDGKSPLIFNFKNGNKTDFRRGNLEYLCYNCYFLYVSDVFNSKQLRRLEQYSAPPMKNSELFKLNKEEPTDIPYNKWLKDLDNMSGEDLISRK